MGVVDFFSKNVIHNEDGYNGFLTILFTAILVTLFEIVFFIKVGINDIKNGLKGVTENAKISIDTKLLGNEKYCRYLYKSKRTEHSNDILNKYCRNVNFDDKLKDITSPLRIPIGDNLYDFKNEANNLKKILENSTDVPDIEIIISSFYDYYRKHPEFFESSGVIKNMLKDKYNKEISYNSWELLFFIIALAITIVSTVKLTDNKIKINFSRIFKNMSVVAGGLILFQLLFYFKVATVYQYEGNQYDELINYYMANSKPVA